MEAMDWIFCVVLITLFSFCIFLLFQGSGSETIKFSAWTMLLAGCAGFIVSTLFVLNTETEKTKFPVTVFYHKDTLVPLDTLEFFASIKRGAISSGSVPRGTGYLLYNSNPSLLDFKQEELLADKNVPQDGQPDDLQNRKFNLGGELYQEYIFYFILDKLCHHFAKSWKIEMERYDSPSLAGTKWTYDEDEKSVSSTRDDIAKLFPTMNAFQFDDRPFTTHVKGKLVLPPKTTMNTYDTGNPFQQGISFDNPFVNVSIAVERSSTQLGLGQIADVIGYPANVSESFLTSTYFVTVEAEYKLLKSAHKRMPSYKEWVNNITYSIQSDLDFNLYWERLKEWRMLFKDERRALLEDSGG